MSANSKVVRNLAIAGSLLLLTAGGSKLGYDNYRHFRDVESIHRHSTSFCLRGRSLADQVNIAYLTTLPASGQTTDDNVDKKLISEHNACFETFKQSGIWSQTYNTPLVCQCLAADCESAKAVYLDRDGSKISRKYLVEGRMLKELEMVTDKTAATNFDRGNQVGHQLLVNGHNIQQGNKPEELKSLIGEFEASLADSKLPVDQREVLVNSLLYIKQTQQLEDMLQMARSQQVDPQTGLLLSMKSHHPILYYTLKWYHQL